MYYLSKDILSEIAIPKHGILSRTLHNDDAVKIILFGFSQGHEFSAHAAPMHATLQILKGAAKVLLGEDWHSLSAGAIVHMPANLTHGVVAESPLVLLLQLFKTSRLAFASQDQEAAAPTGPAKLNIG